MNKNRVVAADEGEKTIGRWGIAWQRFMTDNHPNEVAKMQATERWDELALEIDREAWNLRDLLRKQYSKANPRPTTFMEIVKWEKTCGFYVDHEIMEKIVSVRIFPQHKNRLSKYAESLFLFVVLDNVARRTFEDIANPCQNVQV